MIRRVAILALLGLLGEVVAHADDAPAPDADQEKQKREARALLKEGVRLLGEKDYGPALELFREAYAKFPSAKILLNIGTTLKDMGRPAEAANAYQRYLDAPDTDAARKTEVTGILAVLDAKVGHVTVSAEDGVDVRAGDDDWQPWRAGMSLRVPAGTFTVQARKDGVAVGEASGEVSVGATIELTIAIVLPAAPPVEAPIVTTPEVVAPEDGPETGIVVIAPTPARPRRFGGVVNLAIDGNTGKGGAFSAGLAMHVHDRVDVQATGIIGPTLGAYAGATVRITGGTLRPILAAGFPMFFSDGVRIGARGAAGVEWAAAQRINVVGELGVEHFFNSEDAVQATAFVPIVGVRAWL